MPKFNQTYLELGSVTFYDSETKLYRVSLDRTGDVVARRMLTGVDKPCAVPCRVACVRGIGLDWIILGELDMPTVQPEQERPLTTAEAAAELDTLIRDAIISTRLAGFPSFRVPNETPEFSGDALIQNRTQDPRARSMVKVFSFGSVLSLASKLCFFLLNRRDDTAILRCASLIERQIGRDFTVTTRVDDPRTVVREEIRGDALTKSEDQGSDEDLPPPRIDREWIAGYIPVPGERTEPGDDFMAQPIAERGDRLRFGAHAVIERDNNKHVRRERQDVIENEGEDDEERIQEFLEVEGNVEDEVEGVDVKRGRISIFRDWLRLVIDNEERSLILEDLDGPAPYTISMNGDELALTRGAQSITITDDGVVIKATKLTIESENEVEITAGADTTIKAPAINLDD